MSRRSRNAGRDVVERDPGTYLPLLQQRRRMMNGAAARWDETQRPDEVIIMALALRTMLGNQDRLMDRVLPVGRGVLFCDSALSPSGSGSQSRIGVGGLTVLRLGAAGSAGIVPLCHLAEHDPQKFVRFHTWWRQDVPVVHNAVQRSREFLVTQLANTDGVHVDSVLDPDYHQIAGPVTGLTFKSHGVDTPATGVAGACIRQIAWELDRTLAVGLASRSLE